MRARHIRIVRLRATDPARVAFYLTSRGITNEVYYAAQKAARFLGTNHIDNSARLCHAASTAGMKATLGYGASTCSYVDWLQADLIVFFGSNVANNRLELQAGSIVELRSGSGVFRGRLKAMPITRGNLAVYWPEGNTLLSASAIDRQSMEPDYNAAVTLHAELDAP